MSAVLQVSDEDEAAGLSSLPRGVFPVKSDRVVTFASAQPRASRIRLTSLDDLEESCNNGGVSIPTQKDVECPIRASYKTRTISYDDIRTSRRCHPFTGRAGRSVDLAIDHFWSRHWSVGIDLHRHQDGTGT